MALLLAAAAPAGATSYVYPLKASPSGRYLVDQNGTPFRTQGDAAWSLIANLTYAEADGVNFAAGRSRANNAIVPLGSGGRIEVRCDMPAGSTGSTHFVFDVAGYFK
jgi:hypothetical protein